MGSNYMQSTNRETWVDTLKGFAIICVVIGHVLKGNIQVCMFEESIRAQEFVMNFIYSFHMPLFFTLSGYIFLKYVYRNMNDRRAVKWNVINLVLIYGIYQVALNVLKVIFSSFVNNPVSMNELVGKVFFPASPMWYIYILIFYYLLFPSVYRRLADKSIEALMVFFLVGIVAKWLLNMICAPSCIIRFFYYLQFFWFGKLLYSIEENEEIRKNIRIHKPLIIVACIVPMAIYTAILIFEFDNSIFKLLCSYGLIVLCYLVVRSVKAGAVLLTYTGKHSLEIYLLHTYFVTANRYFFKTSNWGNICIEVMMGVLIGVGFPLLFSRCLDYIPFIKKILFQPGKSIRNAIIKE